MSVMTLNLKQGQVVISKKGRDKGSLFVVLNVATERDGEYAWIVDGAARCAGKPKKKKAKHIQPTKYINYSLEYKLVNGLKINNLDIRDAIAAYEKPAVEEE